MKNLYLFSTILLLLLTAALDLQAESFQGFVITRDGKRLSGSIDDDIFYSNLHSTVTFTNDFGTTYSYRAELIGGFVYRLGAQLVEYESKYKQRQWCFMRVLYRGEALTLYKAPEKKINFAISNRGLETYTSNKDEYWLQFARKRPFHVKRWGFKRKMRHRLRRYPAVAEMIGKKGYRYNDLEDIVKKVNAIHRANRETI